MSCLFGIVIYCTNEDDIYNLQTTIKSIQKINYDKDKVKVVISSSCNKNYIDVIHMINVIKETFPSSEGIFHLDDDVSIRDTECFMKVVDATYFVKITSGGVINSDTLDKINQIFQTPQDLNSFTAFKTETGARLVFDKKARMFETDHATIIDKELVTDHYLNFNDYDLMVCHIRQLCIEQGEYEKIE